MSSYIGETGRTAQKRIAEHGTAVRKGDRNNGVVVHTWDAHHEADWEKVEVIVKERH